MLLHNDAFDANIRTSRNRREHAERIRTPPPIPSPGSTIMATSFSEFPAPLRPRLRFLRREEVLVQAWKKAAGHIRYHNWFSDTLELDWITINLPDFLRDVAAFMESPRLWRNDPIRIVPAPKAQPGWKTTTSSGWEPPRGSPDVPLRPLAHVTLKGPGGCNNHYAVPSRSRRN